MAGQCDVVQLGLFRVDGCFERIRFQAVHVAFHQPHLAMTLCQAFFRFSDSASHVVALFPAFVEVFFDDVDRLPLKPYLLSGDRFRFALAGPAEVVYRLCPLFPKRRQPEQDRLFFAPFLRQNDLFRLAIVFPQFQQPAEPLDTLLHFMPPIIIKGCRGLRPLPGFGAEPRVFDYFSGASARIRRTVSSNGEDSPTFCVRNARTESRYRRAQSTRGLAPAL